MPDRSLFTLDQESKILDWQPENATSLYSVDVATIEFNDDGTLQDPTQLDKALNCIRSTRGLCKSGTVVALFIHGWQHDATIDLASGKGDGHFSSFRALLLSLMRRESERSISPFRRVIGVYFGWRGKPFRSRLLSFLNNFTFARRFRTADTIGGAGDLRRALREIVQATKGPIDGADLPESPIIMIGHSMGALILERGFSTLLREEPGSLIREAGKTTADTACVTQDGRTISFPDMVLLVNSAAAAGVAKKTMDLLHENRLAKRVSSNGLDYAIPLIVSFTAKTDRVTGWIWRLANRFQRTEGHDRCLLTHRLEQSPTLFKCSAKMTGYDFGQSWHCLRRPEASGGQLRSVTIDLPQIKKPRDECHKRFTIRPVSAEASGRPMWVFQVPRHVSRSHGDIWNNRASLFALAMMQISGAVVSVALNWGDVFEDDEGPCDA